MKAALVRRNVVSDLTGNVFGYAGWPSVCIGPEGDLLAVWSGNRIGHICPFGKVLLRRSRDAGRSWSAPIVAVDTPLDDRDAGITLLPDGRLVVTTFNNSRSMQRHWAGADSRHSEAMTWLVESYCDLVTDEQEKTYLGALAAFSADGGESWSEPLHTPVSAPHGVTAYKGEMLYAGTMAVDREPDPNHPILVFASRDGKDWRELSRIPPCEALSDCGHYEPHLCVLGDRLILAVRHDGLNGKNVFTVSTAVSDDGGLRWTPLRPTGANGSPPHMLVLSSGAVVMTYGRRKPPYGIEAQVSLDGGESWSQPLSLIADAPDGDLGYPCSVELPGGEIFTLYYGRQDSRLCKILSFTWRLTKD